MPESLRATGKKPWKYIESTLNQKECIKEEMKIPGTQYSVSEMMRGGGEDL